MFQNRTQGQQNNEDYMLSISHYSLGRVLSLSSVFSCSFMLWAIFILRDWKLSSYAFVFTAGLTEYAKYFMENETDNEKELKKEPWHENPQLAAKNAFDGGNVFIRVFGYIMAFLILSVVVMAITRFFIWLF